MVMSTQHFCAKITDFFSLNKFKTQKNAKICCVTYFSYPKKALVVIILADNLFFWQKMTTFAAEFIALTIVHF